MRPIMPLSRNRASGDYKVLLAESPEEALKLANQHPEEIDLLLTDVVMPGMNGKALAERLGSHRPNMKSLFMSGYPVDVLSQRGILEHDRPFIAKPYSRNDLACKIREVLDGQPNSTSSPPIMAEV